MLPLAILLLVPLATETSTHADRIDDLLERAAQRAVAYERDALRWSCTETVRIAHYDKKGEPSQERKERYDLLLMDDTSGLTELRANGERGNLVPRQKLEFLAPFPPVTAWLQLLHPRLRSQVIIDRNSASFDGLRARLNFRGMQRFVSGESPFEWEGTVSVDMVTGDILEVHASPRDQEERLRHARHVRAMRAVRVTLFQVIRLRIGPGARGRRVEVTFGEQANELWLPNTAHLTLFESVGPSREHQLRTVSAALAQCKTFEVFAVPRTSSKAGSYE